MNTADIYQNNIGYVLSKSDDPAQDSNGLVSLFSGLFNVEIMLVENQ